MSPTFVSFEMSGTVWSPWALVDRFCSREHFPTVLVEFQAALPTCQEAVELMAAFAISLDVTLPGDHSPRRCWEQEDVGHLTNFLGR